MTLFGKWISTAENNHRDADDPDHLQESNEPKVGIKGDTELHERHFEQDQPQPARHQKPRQLRLALAARKLQVRTRAGEKHEDGRAEVCDPAREEQRDVRARQIGRIKLQRRVVNEVARVVQHHDHHHDAAQQVD